MSRSSMFSHTSPHVPGAQTGIVASETAKSAPENAGNDPGQIRELEKEVLDLKIVNKGKDFFIEQLRKERDNILGQLIQTSRKVGELETRMLQLEEPRNE